MFFLSKFKLSDKEYLKYSKECPLDNPGVWIAGGHEDPVTKIEAPDVRPILKYAVMQAEDGTNIPEPDCPCQILDPQLAWPKEF